MPAPLAIPDELIELVAQAIRDQFDCRATFPNGRRMAKPWEKLPPKLRDDYREEARAALRAVQRFMDGKGNAERDGI